MLWKYLCPIHKLSFARLRLFCTHHRISGYKNKTKDVTCGLILQYARLKANTCTMYDPKDNSDNKEDDTDFSKIAGMVASEVPKHKKTKPKQRESSPPDAVSRPGKYYRIINTYMSKKISICCKYWFQCNHGRLGQSLSCTQWYLW